MDLYKDIYKLAKITLQQQKGYENLLKGSSVGFTGAIAFRDVQGDVNVFRIHMIDP